MAPTRDAVVRKSEQQLQDLVRRKDPCVKYGEIFKLEEVRILLKKKDNSDEFEETGKVVCTNCSQLLAMSDGCHIRRHVEQRCKNRGKKRKLEELKDENDEKTEEATEKVRTIDFYNTKKFKTKEVLAMSETLARYCLKSGRSYNHMSSDMMKCLVIELCNVISSGYGQEALKQLPSRQTIQKYSEELAKNTINKAYSEIRPFIGSRVNLIVDHGKHVVNYLSVYASVVDDQFRLKITPLAFIPAMVSKSGFETARLICDRLTKVGWTEEEVFSCHVTADGALKNLSGYFKSYVRCVSHSVNLLAQKVISPLESHKKYLDNEEKELLKRAADIIKDSQQLAMAIRSNSDMCSELPRLPSLPSDTRWISGLKCLSDITDLSEHIQKKSSVLPVKIRTVFDKLILDDKKITASILYVLKPLLEFNNVYQNQKAITLHLVLSSYKMLEANWTKLEHGNFSGIDEETIDVDCLKVLAKSGLLALEHYYSEFTDIHFAATMLSPRTKRMQLFTKDEYEKAKKYIVGLMPKEPTPPRQVVEAKNNCGIANLLRQVSDCQDPEEESNDELERYLGERVDATSNESLEEFWRRKSNEYPSLFSISASIFSVVPSESVCETCFSVAGFLLDKRRTRLQYARAELIVVGSQLSSQNPEWLIDN